MARQASNDAYARELEKCAIDLGNSSLRKIEKPELIHMEDQSMKFFALAICLLCSIPALAGDENVIYFKDSSAGLESFGDADLLSAIGKHVEVEKVERDIAIIPLLFAAALLDSKVVVERAAVVARVRDKTGNTTERMILAHRFPYDSKDNHWHVNWKLDKAYDGSETNLGKREFKGKHSKQDVLNFLVDSRALFLPLKEDVFLRIFVFEDVWGDSVNEKPGLADILKLLSAKRPEQ